MPKRPRINITVSDSEMKAIKAMCKSGFPFLPATSAVKEIIMELTKNTDCFQELVTSAYQRSPEVPMVTCPRDARACEQLPPEEEIKKDINTPLVRSDVISVFKSLRWYGAKLNKDDTPEEFIERMETAFPKVDIVAELTKASQWLMDNPGKRKKKLGIFLMSWMGRPNKPQQPLFKPKESITEKHAKQQNHKRGEW